MTATLLACAAAVMALVAFLVVCLGLFEQEE